MQWGALGIGFVAVAVLTWDYGRPPWIALILAFSFGTYGLAKKTAGVGAIESLAFETALIAPFAIGFLAWLSTTGDSHFTSEGVGHVLLLMSAGVVTAIPLLLFGGAKLPALAKGLGQSIKEFKNASKDEPAKDEKKSDTPAKPGNN